MGSQLHWNKVHTNELLDPWERCDKRATIDPVWKYERFNGYVIYTNKREHYAQNLYDAFKLADELEPLSVCYCSPEKVLIMNIKMAKNWNG